MEGIQCAVCYHIVINRVCNKVVYREIHSLFCRVPVNANSHVDTHAHTHAHTCNLKPVIVYLQWTNKEVAGYAIYKVYVVKIVLTITLI